MVGKIKHVRQKLHQEAVKLERPSSPTQSRHAARSLHSLDKSPAAAAAAATGTHTITHPSILDNNNSGDTNVIKQAVAESSFPTGIFAGTKITAQALVQTLTFEEPPNIPEPVGLPAKKGPEEKKLKPKKEKMKERRERWLNKISSIKQAKEQQAAEARRQHTPVVGDMRPLADALPELCQLIAPATTALTARRKSRKNKVPVKRPEPTDFSQMKQSQKRKLLESENSRFSDAVKTLSAKMNPLADIGEQLRKRMRQEEEQGPS